MKVSKTNNYKKEIELNKIKLLFIKNFQINKKKETRDLNL